MNHTIYFFLNSFLLGTGLSMDSFSVSLASGLTFPDMPLRKIFRSAFVFAFFQAFMPLIGWLFIRTVLKQFLFLRLFIPFISLILLSYIGASMIYDDLQKEKAPQKLSLLSFPALIMQGVATSIDALSAGFVFSDFSLSSVISAVSIIGATTFMICTAGAVTGKYAGARFGCRTGIFGGIILIAIGAEIFLKSFCG